MSVHRTQNDSAAPGSPFKVDLKQKATKWETVRFLITIPAYLCILYFCFDYLFDQGILRLNYPSLRYYPVQGIDISHHQDVIDWSEVAAPEVSFAYIKASEGVDFRDELFFRNWAGAQSANILPGAYHFYSLCKPGKEQAENFLRMLQNLEGASLPPAIDLEFGGNCGARPSPEELFEQLFIFANTLQKRYRCPPVYYVTEEFYNEYFLGRVQDLRLWVRNIYTKPRVGGKDVLFWQFANRGRTSGVLGFVDLDAFQGSERQFKNLVCYPERGSGS